MVSLVMLLDCNTNSAMDPDPKAELRAGNVMSYYLFAEGDAVSSRPPSKEKGGHVRASVTVERAQNEMQPLPQQNPTYFISCNKT